MRKLSIAKQNWLLVKVICIYNLNQTMFAIINLTFKMKKT